MPLLHGLEEPVVAKKAQRQVSKCLNEEMQETPQDCSGYYTNYLQGLLAFPLVSLLFLWVSCLPGSCRILSALLLVGLLGLPLVFLPSW